MTKKRILKKAIKEVKAAKLPQWSSGKHFTERNHKWEKLVQRIEIKTGLSLSTHYRPQQLIVSNGELKSLLISRLERELTDLKQQSAWEPKDIITLVTAIVSLLISLLPYIIDLINVLINWLGLN